MTAADRWVEIDTQNRIHLKVLDAGSDVTLVLWCGLGSTADSFLHFLREGGDQGINVVAIDPPGHGLSPVWAAEFSAADAQQIWRSVVHENPCVNSRQVWIGGHSYGAYTALMALPVVEDRIAGLVLLDGGYLEPFPAYNRDEVLQGNSEYLACQRYDSWDAYLAHERAAARHWDGDTEAILRSNMKENDGVIVPVTGLDGAMQACDVLSAYRVDELMESERPALLLQVTEPAEMEGLRKEGVVALGAKLSRLEVIRVDGGHDLPVDNPAAMTEAVWTFLNRHRYY